MIKRLLTAVLFLAASTIYAQDKIAEIKKSGRFYVTSKGSVVEIHANDTSYNSKLITDTIKGVPSWIVTVPKNSVCYVYYDPKRKGVTFAWR